MAGQTTEPQVEALAGALQREAGHGVAQGGVVHAAAVALDRARGFLRGTPPARSRAGACSAAAETSSSISRSLSAHVAPVGAGGHRQQVLHLADLAQRRVEGGP